MTERYPRRLWLLALLETHEASLLRYAARLTGDAEKARDLVQESFLRLWRSGPEELGEGAAPWLYAVCRNLAFDHTRKERRMQAWTDDMAPVAPETPREGADGLLAALGALPASQQEVLRLKFQEGLSYKDISQVTGHSVSHVGVLIHEGVKTLRARLASPSQPIQRKGGRS